MVAIFLPYLKQDASDKVDVLHADKHKSFLQINTMIFDEYGQTFPKFPK